MADQGMDPAAFGLSPQSQTGGAEGVFPQPQQPGVLPQVPFQAGQGQPELTELARLVATAAQAAAQAAQAAAATSGATSSSSKDQKDLYKLIPKPPGFSPSDREQEVAQWRDWFWVFKQYLLVVDGSFEKDLEDLDKNVENEVDWDLLDDQEQKRGRFLYSLLSTLLSGRLLSLVRNVEHSNGLEALRQLLQNCQPKARNRTLSMLQSLMAYPAFNMKSSVMAQVMRLEEHFTQYERLGGKVGDEMKTAILLKSISGPLKVHLNLSLNEGSSYAKVREVIRAYDTATTKWSDATSIQYPLQPYPDTSGPAPMDIDRLQAEINRLKGQKGKDGKAKGKGKEPKGKGKGKDQKGKGKGQGKSEPWNSQKGGQKGQFQRDGEGGKGKKGKGAAVVCFNCNRPGHVAKECWRPPSSSTAVRQVGGSDGNSTASASGVAESVGPSASQVNQAAAVKRIAFAQPEDGQSAIFDLRPTSSSTSSGNVRMVKFFYIDEDEDKDNQLDVRKVKSSFEEEKVYLPTEEIKIIVDSGADCPLFPASMIGCGEEYYGPATSLQDAQGNKIPTLGQRSISVDLVDINGVKIELRDTVMFSHEVHQPILSYGRLMDAGWSICAETRCWKNGQYYVPVEMQNHSVVVQAKVRAISEVEPTGCVRAVQVELTEGLQNYVDNAFGWSREGSRWIGVHLSNTYQDPVYIPGLDVQVDWLRTILIKKDGKWIMVEYCEKVSEMMEADRFIAETPGRTAVVTFLTSGFEDVETMGFAHENWQELQDQQQELEDEIEPFLDIPEAMVEPEEDLELRAELGLEGIEGPGLDGDQHDPPPAVPQDLQEAAIVIGEVLPHELVVNGVTLSAISTLKNLRQACKFYEIGQSGSKQIVFRRLAQHQKYLELLAVQSAVAKGKAEGERNPVPQALVKPPTEQERELHELTHTPYQPWCESCLKHRARQDKHLRSGKSHSSGIPIISMDFAVTKKKEGLDPNPEGAADDRGALWLVLTCSQTGYLGVVPVQSKGQINYMTHEVLTYVQNLGNPEVGFYGDNEPTIRQILRTVITSRHALGLKTKIFSTKIRDSAGNAPVENSIQRIRQLACTLVEDVVQKTGMVFPCEHPIWSWAGKHASWCLNRFQVTRNTTP